MQKYLQRKSFYIHSILYILQRHMKAAANETCQK